eukprot:m.188306 g.188306  ORF g.188306 m.188306 type:complete len:599 (+) comp18525_c0_seq1:236-2032(+)
MATCENMSNDTDMEAPQAHEAQNMDNANVTATPADVKGISESSDTTGDSPQISPGLIDHPELIEDFVRNFLMQKGMHQTLDTFQTEWYRKMYDGNLDVDRGEKVLDCYMDNMNLRKQISTLTDEASQARAMATAASAIEARLRKERDFHRLSHRRIKEENRSLKQKTQQAHNDVEALSKQINVMREKYETVTRQKTMANLNLERSLKEVDEMVNLSQKVLELSHTQVITLEEPVTSSPESENSNAMHPPPGLPDVRREFDESFAPSMAATQTSGVFDRVDVPDACVRTADTIVAKHPPQLRRTFRAHEAGVTSLTQDPTGEIIATASDDGTMRTWQLSSGEPLLEGVGHGAWISSCRFNRTGNMVATASGDATVKLWNTQEGTCAATLSGHAYAVWDVAFHTSGDFVASGSMDNTVKLWDIPNARCQRTLRGHTDAVNSVAFQTHSNLAVSASADRLCKLWDMRQGLQVRTLGDATSRRRHANACTSAVFSPSGDRLASVDASGKLLMWEMRTGSASDGISVGKTAINQCIFDPTGRVLGVACEDCSIKLFDANDLQRGALCELQAHNDAVQGILFGPVDGMLVSGSADGTVRKWDWS